MSEQNCEEGDLVPVIVDQTVINKLQLQIGSTFAIRVNNAVPASIHCSIVGIVNRIPTISSLFSSTTSSNATPITTGGVLMDYQTYFHAYQQDAQAQKIPPAQLTLPTVNQVWLHTTDDPVALASIRSALNGPTFRLAHLADRRLLLSTLQSDPLYLIMDGVLTIGTLTALLLALVGGLLVSWISARSRLMNMVTLRALGGTSEQVAGIFSWEQAIIALTGFILGGGFGFLLATSVIPALTFTDLNSDLSDTQFFALQSALSAQLVVPPTLPLLVLAGIALYIAVLILMVRVVSRAGLSQTLRLNED